MTAMLHRFSKFVVACTVLLILAGSLVTSHDAGLSVPDWPTSYGWNMFTFPPSMWVANILYEHGHRLIASTVGFLTIVLAVWLWLTESRRWLRWLGVAALGAVVAQGVLGGLTVIFFLPAAISTAHAGLAEVFFCMTVAIALFTSPRWIAGYGTAKAAPHAAAPYGAGPHDAAPEIDDVLLRRLATATTAAIFPADSHRRDDAAHGRGVGDPRLPVDVRTRRARSLVRADRYSFRASGRCIGRHRWGHRVLGVCLVASS